MLHKLLNVGKLAPFFSHVTPKPAAAAPVLNNNFGSSVLKIIHVGGIVELYYMAIPAVTIMKKYPSFLLARPEVFRRPWDSLVPPEEILLPGERFFVVPHHTVKKLQRRIRKPIMADYLAVPGRNNNSTSDTASASSFSLESSMETASRRLRRRCKTSGRTPRKNVNVAWNPTLTIIPEGP